MVRVAASLSSNPSKHLVFVATKFRICGVDRIQKFPPSKHRLRTGAVVRLALLGCIASVFFFTFLRGHQELVQDKTAAAKSSASSSEASVDPKGGIGSPPASYGNCSHIKWLYYDQGNNSYTSLTHDKDDHYNSNDRINYHNKPIFVPSFPGSGAEMFRQIIETMTGGIKGWSSYFERNRTGYKPCHKIHAATCKTHFPVLDHIVNDDPDPQTGKFNPLSDLYKENYDDDIILLVRNPRKAFASRLNHLWEMKNNVQFHSRQAPERAWNRWISQNFQMQILKYQELIRSWALVLNTNITTSHHDYKRSHSLGDRKIRKNKKVKDKPAFLPLSKHYKVSVVLPYEGLIDPVEGPLLMSKLVRVLQKAKIPRVASNHDIRCLWEWVVMGDGTGTKTKRAGHKYTPRYTTKQQGVMLQMLDELVEDFRSQAQASAVTNREHSASSPHAVSNDIVRILEGYRRDIANDIPLVKNKL